MNPNEDCLFCKIVNGEIPSFKLRENDHFLAILDIFPNCKWQTLVIAKHHYDSDLFEIEDTNFYLEYMKAIKEVVSLLKEWLKVKKVWMILEWMWVNHLHIKLYPMFWLEDDDRKDMVWKERVYFEKYNWYITSKMWNLADNDELIKLQEEIKSAN